MNLKNEHPALFNKSKLTDIKSIDESVLVVSKVYNPHEEKMVFIINAGSNTFQVIEDDIGIGT